MIVSGKDDPLLAALIDKLPKPGAWTAEGRTAWLKMVAMAFDVVYGPVDGVEIPEFLSERRPAPLRIAAAIELPANGLPPNATVWTDEKIAEARGKVGPAFYIDDRGFARKAGGERVLASDVSGAVLYDQRGEQADLGAIVWADDTRGVTGLQLEISARAA